jgi:hypothetical protein
MFNNLILTDFDSVIKLVLREEVLFLQFRIRNLAAGAGTIIHPLEFHSSGVFFAQEMALTSGILFLR